LNENLLGILVCPDCHAPFNLKSARLAEGQIVSGDLQCTACAGEYPVVKGIPRLLPENVRTDNYSRNFQYYWLNMNWPRHDFNRGRFYQLTEWRPQDIQGKYVMDAGCGGGRWVYQFADAGAKEIVAFDYTLAIERAQEICSRFSHIHYIQADIFRMPFRENLFDIVHCHGVLMATPDPKKGVENLARRVRPGGELAILLYRNLTAVQQMIDDLVCGITSRLPTRMMYYLTVLPTLFEYVPGAVPVFENIIHLSGQPDFTLKHLHNFDWYTCQYRHRNSPVEVRQWLNEFGFTDTKVLNTNDFRTRSRFAEIAKLKEKLLEMGCFLKATLGCPISI